MRCTIKKCGKTLQENNRSGVCTNCGISLGKLASRLKYLELKVEEFRYMLNSVLPLHLRKQLEDGK